VEKFFSAPNREEAHQIANEWLAAQTGLRNIKLTEIVTGDDGPSLLEANRRTVTIHYE